jgi:hypothetical protein
MCATPDCNEPTVGKSKYCKAHREAARVAWKARVGMAEAERADRYAGFADLFARAEAAGEAALVAAVPEPMVVQQRSEAFNDNSPVVQSWYVPEGVCGFGWVTITPGTSSAARWAVKNAGFRKAYGGGVQLWISAGGQSYDRKAAYAEAYADVLRAGLPAGTHAYAGGRLD